MATPLDGQTELLRAWDSLYESSLSGIKGNDLTYSSAWARALETTLLSDRLPISVAAVVRDGKTLALWPFVRRTGPMGLRQIEGTTEAHSGRTSFLVHGNSRETSIELLDTIVAQAQWDVSLLTIVEGSVAHAVIYEAQQSKRIKVRCIDTVESPYVELKENWDATFATLPKKFRWTLRKAEKDLSALGELAYREYRDATDVDALLAAIYAIEQRSWKEGAGSSITTHPEQRRFYEELVRYAASAGYLSAHLLTLNTEPLAYILGLHGSDGAFLDLKESFVDSHSQYSPAHVLKRFALPALIERGIRIYDFMGVCEPYKMRWTDKTYKRYTVNLYANSLRGSFMYLRSLLSKSSKPLPSA